MGVETGISILLALLDRVAAWSALIMKARAEGRDISEAEIDALAKADNVAKAAMEKEIAAARAAGG